MTEQFNQTTGTSQEPQCPPKGESTVCIPSSVRSKLKTRGHWDRIGPRTQTLDTPTMWCHSDDPSPLPYYEAVTAMSDQNTQKTFEVKLYNLNPQERLIDMG